MIQWPGLWLLPSQFLARDTVASITSSLHHGKRRQSSADVSLNRARAVGNAFGQGWSIVRGGGIHTGCPGKVTLKSVELSVWGVVSPLTFWRPQNPYSCSSQSNLPPCQCFWLLCFHWRPKSSLKWWFLSELRFLYCNMWYPVPRLMEG